MPDSPRIGPREFTRRGWGLRYLVGLGLALLVWNGVFLSANLLASLIDPGLIRDRVAEGFRNGQLTTRDVLPFDWQRGFHQYDDCLILQVLQERNEGAVAAALAPMAYWSTEHGPCEMLLALNRGDEQRVSTSSRFPYSRYWMGSNTVTALLLSRFSIATSRRALQLAVLMALAPLVTVVWRAGPRTRLVGGVVAISLTFFWSLLYFSANFAHAPGDIALILGLAVAVPVSSCGGRAGVLYLALGLGACLTYFEWWTGQLPTAAALLVALVFSGQRDRGYVWTDALRTTSAALAVMVVSSVATLLIKWGLARLAIDSGALQVAGSQLAGYMAFTASERGVPGPLVPLARLIYAAVESPGGMVFGSRLAAVGLLSMSILGWLNLTVAALRRGTAEYRAELLVLAASAGLVVVWTLMFQTHTANHMFFMYRMLVVPVALGLVGLLLPGLWAASSEVETTLSNDSQR